MYLCFLRLFDWHLGQNLVCSLSVKGHLPRGLTKPILDGQQDGKSSHRAQLCYPSDLEQAIRPIPSQKTEF